MSTPVIIIPGFGQSKLELTPADRNQTLNVWPIKTDKKKIARAMAPSYLASVITRGDRGFGKKAYSLFSSDFAPFGYDDNGKALHPVRALEYRFSMAEASEKIRSYLCRIAPIQELKNKIGEENVFFFAYNFFEPIQKITESLREFVDFVLGKTGSDKVNFLVFSMGGAVAGMYFAKFAKNEKVGKVLCIACALKGNISQEDLLVRNVDRNQGYSLMSFAVNSEIIETLRKALIPVPPVARYSLLYASLDAMTDSILLRSPGMWSLIPDDSYPELSKKMIGDAKFDKLRAVTDEYHETRLRFPDIFTKARESGVEFYAFVGYGLKIMPMFLSNTYSTDGTLTVSSAGLGVESAPLGETLNGETVENGGTLTADRTVDTATGFFGKNAHFFQNVTHEGFASNPEAQKLAAEILG